MNGTALLAQLLELIVALLLAPILMGWVNQCRAWLQNRSAPPLLQIYYTIIKLFHKDVVLAHNASSLFRMVPYLLFSCMALAAAIVPTLSTELGLDLDEIATGNLAKLAARKEAGKIHGSGDLR